MGNSDHITDDRRRNVLAVMWGVLTGAMLATETIGILARDGTTITSTVHRVVRESRKGRMIVLLGWFGLGAHLIFEPLVADWWRGR